jgi:Protein of unknown function (DUF4197)
MLKSIVPVFLTVILMTTACTTAQLVQTATTVLENIPLSNQDVAAGLKEALTLGIGSGSDFLSAKDGYYKSAYKVLLPKEVRDVTDKLKNVPGFTNVEEVLLEKINRGAEDAATKAKPIFMNAIRQMSFSDAMGILTGKENAATQYLQKATTGDVYKEFNPVIVESLNKFSAIEYWAKAVNTYNQIPFVSKLNPKLDDYVTTEAMKGLYSMVEKEEIGIRKDKTKRVTDILRRVFAKQDK